MALGLGVHALGVGETMGIIYPRAAFERHDDRWCRASFVYRGQIPFAIAGEGRALGQASRAIWTRDYV